jgi:hypothetical protein
VDEGIEGLASRPEFHQHINVALLTLLPPGKRAKNAELAYAESLDLIVMRLYKQ